MANIAVFLLMIALVAVLFRGVYTLLRGTDAAKSNRLMVWRVVIQGLILFILVAFLAKG